MTAHEDALAVLKHERAVQAINYQSSVDKQMRVAMKLRKELELTSEAYEKVVAELREELRKSQE